MKSVEDYVSDIKKALRKAGCYTPPLDLQVVSLAGALRTLAIANKEIDGLETTTVMELTRYGEKMAPHPAFKVQRDAQDSITRQLKALGLTAADLMGENEEDPLIKLTKKVKEAGGSRRGEVIRPDD